MGCSKLGQQPFIRGRTPLCCPRTWSYKYFCSQLRWYGRGKTNQQLDCGNYFLVHSEWNLKSTLLVILQDSPPKPKIKKLAKAPTTPPETPPESPTLTYTTAPADTTAHRRGDHLLRDGTSSSSSSHQSKNRELFRMKVSWVRLSGDVTFPEPVRPALRHGLFLNMSRSFYRFQNHIIPVVLLTQVNSSIVSDVLYICLLTGVFSFSIFLSAAF